MSEVVCKDLAVWLPVTLSFGLMTWVPCVLIVSYFTCGVFKKYADTALPIYCIVASLMELMRGLSLCIWEESDERFIFDPYANSQCAFLMSQVALYYDRLMRVTVFDKGFFRKRFWLILGVYSCIDRAVIMTTNIFINTTCYGLPEVSFLKTFRNISDAILAITTVITVILAVRLVHVKMIKSNKLGTKGDFKQRRLTLIWVMSSTAATTFAGLCKFIISVIDKPLEHTSSRIIYSSIIIADALYSLFTLGAVLRRVQRRRQANGIAPTTTSLKLRVTNNTTNSNIERD